MRDSVGWSLLRLTDKILSMLGLTVNFFLLRSLKETFLRWTLFKTHGWNSSIFTPNSVYKGSSTFDKPNSSYKLRVCTVFWIRARYNACRALTHQGCKWKQLKMPDKIPEMYPLQYRALDASANPKYWNLRVTWNNTCNFAYVAKFESL